MSSPAETIQASVGAAAEAGGVPAPSGTRSGFASVLESISSKIGIILLNAATGILTARALKPVGRGELAAMIIWSLFLASATTLGVPSSAIYYLRRRPDLSAQLKSTAMFMSAILGAVAAVVGAISLPALLHQYPVDMIRYAQWFLLLTPICSMTLTGRAILEAEGRFSGSNLVQTFTPAVTLAVLIMCYLSHALTPFTAAGCYIFAALPTFALLLRQLGSSWLDTERWSISAARLLLTYGARSYGIDLLGTLALQVDQVLVVNLLNPASMGSYVVVLSLSRMLNLFQNSVVMVLFPKAAGKSPSEILAITEQSARLSTTVTAFCGIGVCIFGPLLLKVLYGKEYVGAATPLRLLTVEVTLSGLVFILAQAFMALGRPGIVTGLQALGLSLSVPLMLRLVPTLGVTGAAVALLVSTTARMLLVFFAYPKMLGLPLPNLWPRLSDYQMIARKVRSRKL